MLHCNIGPQTGGSSQKDQADMAEAVEPKTSDSAEKAYAGKLRQMPFCVMKRALIPRGKAQAIHASHA